jgi:hypothetical protein
MGLLAIVMSFKPPSHIHHNGTHHERKRLMVWTKERKKEYNKEYRLKNKEQIKEHDKEYYLKNREKRIKYQREYRSIHQEANREHSRKYYFKNKERLSKNNTRNAKERRKTNPSLRILDSLRSRMLHALKGKNKSASTMELIGCTIEELRRHIESKFEPWMTWKNHGLWDIDHIKACANFDFTHPEQQRACFNWSNLQPLEHIANIKKGAK